MRTFTRARVLIGAGAVAMSVLLTPAVASAQPEQAPPQRVATSEASVLATCNYSTVNGQGFAGHYSGVTQEPSTTQVTSAGLEAQCLLVRYGEYNPGAIDGVFGRNSQAAARQFQTDMNNWFNAGLATDGMVGRNTWPWLRWFMA